MTNNKQVDGPKTKPLIESHPVLENIVSQSDSESVVAQTKRAFSDARDWLVAHATVLEASSAVIGVATVVFGVIFYVLDSGNNSKIAHYTAWQVVYAAEGKSSVGGRIEALQDLAKDGVDMQGVELSNAILDGINLEHARLNRANFSSSSLVGANLWNAQLIEATLIGANLTNADLSAVNLQSAILTGANLQSVYFRSTNAVSVQAMNSNMANAELGKTSLSQSCWRKSNFMNTFMYFVKIEDSDVREVSFEGAELDNVSFNGSDLRNATFRRVHFANVSFLKANIEGVDFRGSTGIDLLTLSQAYNWRQALLDSSVVNANPELEPLEVGSQRRTSSVTNTGTTEALCKN